MMPDFLTPTRYIPGACGADIIASFLGIQCEVLPVSWELRFLNKTSSSSLNKLSNLFPNILKFGIIFLIVLTHLKIGTAPV